MTLRLFRCHACGHRMRMKGKHCNRCYQEKPFFKRRSFVGSVAILALFSITAMFLSVLLA